jgi:hypothetical protein
MKTTIENKDSCFPHHSKGHLMSFASIWHLWNIYNSLFANSLTSTKPHFFIYGIKFYLKKRRKKKQTKMRKKITHKK